jgi:hypothetical protein
MEAGSVNDEQTKAIAEWKSCWPDERERLISLVDLSYARSEVRLKATRDAAVALLRAFEDGGR